MSNSRAQDELWKVPTSIAIWGGTPGQRGELALAIARRIDKQFYWLQVEESPRAREDGEAELLQKIPQAHLFTINPVEIAPQDIVANAGAWFARGDASALDRVRVLRDYLRLPEVYKRLMEGRQPLDPVKAVVAANVDRPRPLWPSEAGGIRPYIEAINEYAFTTIFTIYYRPNPNTKDVDYLLRLEGTPAGREGPWVMCERGAPIGTPGLFPEGLKRELSVVVREIGSE